MSAIDVILVAESPFSVDLGLSLVVLLSDLFAPPAADNQVSVKCSFALNCVVTKMEEWCSRPWVFSTKGT